MQNIDVKSPEKRHTCIVCDRKKAASKMIKTRSHWHCIDCISIPGSTELRDCAARIVADNKKINVLNLYAGIGGNRKLWTGVNVTALERDVKVAAAYKSLFPEDNVIVADAHQYLLKNYQKFDIIWSSPPCQTHSRMNHWITGGKKRFADLSLYQEILFLKEFFKGIYIVENVTPYYEPLISPSCKIGRHLFWSNIQINQCHIPQLPGFIDLQDMRGKKLLMDWLGIYYEKNLYLGAKDYTQVFRNCVHPGIGRSIFDDIIEHLKTKGS